MTEGDENGIEITASEDSTRELAAISESTLIRLPPMSFECFLLNASEIKSFFADPVVLIVFRCWKASLKEVPKMMEIIIAVVGLIVGGGIRTPESARKVVAAGADIVVTGTFVEKSLSLQEEMTALTEAIHSK